MTDKVTVVRCNVQIMRYSHNSETLFLIIVALHLTIVRNKVTNTVVRYFTMRLEWASTCLRFCDVCARTLTCWRNLGTKMCKCTSWTVLLTSD